MRGVFLSLFVVGFLWGEVGMGLSIRKPEGQAMPHTYTNPVNDKDMPDPGVLQDGNVYWMTHTMGSVPSCPLWKSTDLVHWTFVKHMMDESNRPPWVKDRFWAPELHKVGSTYILIFTSGDVTGHLCIGMATAPAVTGPYTFQQTPLVRDEAVGVIDPTLFQDTDRKNYLIWKDDGNAIGRPCHLFLRELDRTGTAFTPGSTVQTLLTSQPTGWENNLIEAPEMIKHGRWYYLFYSGNHFTDGYAVGVARSEHPTGGFERCPQNPILHGNAVWINPGHGSFVQDAKGTVWHLYHAYHADDRRRGRVQLLDRIDWDRLPGWPAFGNDGTPSITPQPTPATP